MSSLGLRLLAAGLLLVAAGCDVDPYCVTCADGDIDAADEGGVDGGRSDADVDARPGDAAPDGDAEPEDAGCRAEECNEEDDDCDGLTDEDFDTTRDPRHCGECDMACIIPHAVPMCVDSMCRIQDCDPEFYDLDEDPENGCEYRCAGIPGSDDAVCDLRDGDCDGLTDEDVDFAGDEVNCGWFDEEMTRGRCGHVCGFPHAIAACEMGECIIDDCEDGFHDLDMRTINGCEYACTVAGDETCNRRDDDCDGMTDEGDPGGGDSCGMEEGECTTGTTMCVGGTIECMGSVRPTAEECNDLDDDCDMMTDEGNPEGGRLCGSAVGTCSPGRETCVDGDIECVGAITTAPEECDGLDNDCDGTIDDGNPDGGAACGTDVGTCDFGVETCSGATLVCIGGRGPAVEICDTLDNDCNGTADNGFDLTTDIDNCGMCGRSCRASRAVTACVGSGCVLLGCEPGFHDIDGMLSTGCEYACSPTGFDGCDGRDNDCDMRIDEGLTPPMGFCLSRGVCAGTAATCGGMAGWTCSYPAATYEPSEVSCDTLDNDCDGRTDEAFPLLGTTCANGVGSCRRTGVFVCNAAEDGVRCTAPPAGTPASEACDNSDNDCDGVIDERRADDPGTPWRDGINVDAISTVVVNRPGGGTMRIMQYEASRPDATSSAPGTVDDFACSRADVVPWTTVTFDEARAACCALNPGGTCPGAGVVGFRLCSAPEWETACEGPTGTCDWSYSSSCTTSQPMMCNGKEFDCLPATGDQDCLFNTGSASFPGCRTAWGAAGSVYDLSGNVREWTDTESPPASGFFELRGGAYQTIEEGRACEFDFAVARRTNRFTNTGFRCCYY